MSIPVSFQTAAIITLALALLNYTWILLRPPQQWPILTHLQVNEVVVATLFASLNLWNLTWMIHYRMV